MTVIYIVLILLAVLFGLLFIALIRTLLVKKKISTYAPESDPDREQIYASKLSKMVQQETISVRGQPEPDKFRQFHAVLEELYPNVFAKCEKIDLDGNLLIKWKGKTDEDPLMLMSHQDVVAPGHGWSVDPFGGDIIDGKIYGRGTGDTKGSVMAFYQAVEELIQEGYVPHTDVYLSSSCTEEIAGDGAGKIVAWLKEHNIRLFMLCDEGGGILSEPIGGIPGRYAMIGVFEKGQGDVKFTAKSSGGHSAAPPKNTPIPRLAGFIQEVETRDPMKSQFEPEVKAMFERLAPYAGFGLRYVLSNFWLFQGVLKKILPAMNAQAGAMLKTTVAFTRMQGSDGYNVIPEEAWVSANLRFIPHQKARDSIAVLEEIAKKYDLETEVLQAADPSRAVDLSGRPFQMTEEVIAQTFPGLPAIPYVVTGGTDCRFYEEVCDACIRFAPLVYGPEQLKGMHGLDENIEINCLPGAVDYYKNMIRAQENR